MPHQLKSFNSQAQLDYPEIYKLMAHEEDWVRYQPFLQERGYILRPRYRPGWVPESLLQGKNVWECEDSFPQFHRGILDATRISDGVQVVLKMVDRMSAEIQIPELLSKHTEHGNPAIPVIDAFPIPDDAERLFMVMPRMRDSTATPFFKTVREFVEFLQQVLEGLVFLHSNNIAHLDICPSNVVVDSSTMIPGGFHFIDDSTSDGLTYITDRAKFPARVPFMNDRTTAGPLHYYFIDFSHSVRFPSFESRELITGDDYEKSTTQFIPEISATVPYDPFKVDVRMVGEMLREDFISSYVGLEFVIPLVQKLLRRQPARRPDATETLKIFERLVLNLSEKQLDQRLVFHRRTSTAQQVWREVALLFKGVL
ncbi:kinase-like domain-containing protein [Mycena metata]|uniref:Kinase-like domain-containing protein n=1 Tax=Mycena metata TaxID=1033252 RepID=A0AAD7N2Q0_9AGAR|nr:kinase-like domain-containing protein [Mycena metata]